MKGGPVARAGQLLWLLAGLTAPLPAQDRVANPHVRISLVPEFSAVRPGGAVGLAVRFELDPDWHIYWENPGQSGIATTVDWSVPPGSRVAALSWPVPERFLVAGIVTHVHHGSLALTTRLTLPAPPGSGPARIGAEVRYGICRDSCIPGSARLAVELPWVMAEPRPNPDWGVVTRIASARAALPPGAAPPVTGRLEDSVAVLVVRLPAGAPPQVTFFPADRGVAPGAVSGLAGGDRRAVLRLPLVGTPAGPLRGILVLGDPDQAAPRGYLLSVRLARK
jgi:thiol:disulfide interchange protein DsbD